jgi:probable F420-dependent oxidoreductase
VTADAIDIGRFGVRAWQLSDADMFEAVDAAAELEELGYGTVWLRASGFFERAEALLAGTRRLVVASSVINIWQQPAREVSAAAFALSERFPGRLLVGIGVGHRPLVDRAAPGRFHKPVERMGAYLDELDNTQPRLDVDHRILAALGPRILEVARERSLGTHPYLVTPAHTENARELLGPGRLVAPAHVAILERDPVTAREIGRRHLVAPYLRLPNYRRTLQSLGFSEDEMRMDGVSDRLVDALVLSGDAGLVARRLTEHLEAGADHVAVHLLAQSHDGDIPRAAWRELAIALGAASAPRR